MGKGSGDQWVAGSSKPDTSEEISNEVSKMIGIDNSRSRIGRSGPVESRPTADVAVRNETLSNASDSNEYENKRNEKSAAGEPVDYGAGNGMNPNTRRRSERISVKSELKSRGVK